MGWDYDCAVIGGGPGGLVASLYLARFRRRVILFNAGTPRAWWIPETRNLIGFDRGISGRVLLRRLHRQIGELGVEVQETPAKVQRLSRASGGYRVIAGTGAGSPQLTTPNVILATGISDVQPGIDNLIELRRDGLLRYCSICDGFEYCDEPVVVLAQDAEGIAKALFIRHWTAKLQVLVHESASLPAAKVGTARSQAVKVVRYGQLRLERRKTLKGLWVHLDERKPFYARAAYVELGAQVNDFAFRDLSGIRRASDGLLQVDLEQRVGPPGLFAVGDCVNVLGQISVAAGQAAVSATAIHNSLMD